MEQENSFYKNLENGVIDKDEKYKLEKERDELIARIKEVESSPIFDPRFLGNLRNELKDIEKRIDEAKAKKDVENGIIGNEAIKDENENVKKEENKIEEEKEVETKDENSLNEALKDEKAKEEENLKVAYHDALLDMYNKRLDTIKRQIQDGKFVSSREDFEQELKLEAKMYEARDRYMSCGKDDPYTKLRTELIEREKEAKEPIERELRERARKYKLLEEELRKLDKEQSEINEKLLNPDITDEQTETLNKRMEELGYERKNVETKIAELKVDLEPVIDERRKQVLKRAGLDKEENKVLTYEDKLNKTYQEGKVDIMNSNFNRAVKIEYDNIKRRIEEREEKIKQINKELKETPDTDFERRLTLLNELDKESNMLEADREAKSDLDRGVSISETEMKIDANEKLDDEEYRQKEFDKNTEEVREAIKKQDEEIGENEALNPEIAEEKEQAKKEQVIEGAVIGAAVIGEENGTLKDEIAGAIIGGTIAKDNFKGNEFEEMLHKSTNVPNTKEEAQAIIDANEKADEELDNMEKNIEQKLSK